MKLPTQIAQAIAYRFRPIQLYNRARYEVASTMKLLNCNYHPIWLHFYVTSRCNFRCRFCTNHADGEIGKLSIGYHKPLVDMTLLKFEEAINRFDRAMVCTLCGVGEPFLNPEIFHMITYAKSKRMITEVVTNGSFLSPPQIEKILESKLDRITISLLESEEENYNFLINIKRNVFSKITRDIASLVAARNQRRAKLEIKISRVLTRSDLSKAEEFIQLGVDLGVDKIIFHNLIFAEITAFELAECLFEDSPTQEYFERLKVKYEPYVQIETPTLLKRDLKDKKPSCRWYWKNMCVDADGNTSGCGRFITPKPEYGNVAASDPFNSSHFADMRNSFIENDILDVCKNCVESSQ